MPVLSTSWPHRLPSTDSTTAELLPFIYRSASSFSRLLEANHTTLVSVSSTVSLAHAPSEKGPARSPSSLSQVVRFCQPCLL